jgi:plastocyanin
MNARLAPLLGGVLLVAFAAAACSSMGGAYSNPMSPSPTPSPSPSPTPSPVGATLTIGIVAMDGSQSFAPNPSLIQAGDTVAFYNGDSTVHRIVADGGAFDTGNLNPGATSASLTIAEAGAFGYHCVIHPTMVGTLNVTSQ